MFTQQKQKPKAQKKIKRTNAQVDIISKFPKKGADKSISEAKK